jgi:hypothetical protein
MDTSDDVGAPGTANTDGGSFSAGWTRRSVLASAAGIAAVVGTRGSGKAGLAAAAGPRTAAAGPSGWGHAVGDPRGSAVAVKVGRFAEGRFGVMFKRLPPYGPPDEVLRMLAAQMGEPTSTNPFDLDNPKVTSGMTFFGQFIDHDMTLDRTPMPDQQTDPNALTNFDSPLFDLDAVYGRGPAVSPELYDPDGSGRLRVGRTAEGVDDLPRRADGSAILGDARNDENLILSQLHLLFLKFHNRCLSSRIATSFAEAQRLTRWHYQWVIVHDFLTQVVGESVVRRFLSKNPPKVKREFYKPKNPHRPMMPIEYSVAAYRFGHSLVRAAYLTNERGGTRRIAPIFGAEGSDLRGNRPLPARFEIDWWHFFDLAGAPASPAPARRIDGKLSLPLFNLPPTVVKDAMVSLAERNLTRGKRLGLSAGQDVATAMGITPLTNAELALPGAGDARWAGQAPLWFYVLREAELQHGGEQLGDLGGRLVAEVILGILDSDKSSYLHAKPSFRPAPPVAPVAGQFSMGNLIQFAQGV